MPCQTLTFAQRYKHGYTLHVARWIQAFLSDGCTCSQWLNDKEMRLFADANKDILKVWPLLRPSVQHFLAQYDFSNGVLKPSDVNVFFTHLNCVMKALKEFSDFDNDTQNRVMQLYFPNEKCIVQNEHRYVTLLKRDTIVSLLFNMDPVNERKWIDIVLARVSSLIQSNE